MLVLIFLSKIALERWYTLDTSHGGEKSIPEQLLFHGTLVSSSWYLNHILYNILHTILNKTQSQVAPISSRPILQYNIQYPIPYHTIPSHVDSYHTILFRSISDQLSTNTTVVVSYGRIETRVKLPSAQGLWPSIWMLPQDSPYGGWASSGAIDILQARNHVARVHGWAFFVSDLFSLHLLTGHV